MYFLKSLTLAATVYIAGGSGATINRDGLLGIRDGKASNAQCKVDGEPCVGLLDCCLDFYCGSRGFVPHDNKCHHISMLHGCNIDEQACKADSDCCSGKCENEKCMINLEPAAFNAIASTREGTVEYLGNLVSLA